MKISEFLKSAAIIVVILLVFGLAAFGLNFHTAPLIEANNAGAELAPLLEVLPTGKTFEELDLATAGLPENVVKAYKETNGAGFVFEVTSTGYAAGLVIRVGVDADGKVAGSSVVSSNETWGQETSLNGKYNGQAIDSLELIIANGATANSATSLGYNKAVEGALAAHVLLSGGKLDPSMVFEGMIASLHTGMGKDGILKATEIAGSGNIVKGWKALNGSGAAFVINEGESAYLAIVNAAGCVKVYDEEKNDVTDAHSALADEALKASEVDYKLGGGIKNKIKNFNKEFSAEATDSSQLMNFTTFNTVTTVVRFTVNGEVMYLVQTKPLTYGDAAMTIYTFMNENGEIVKQDTSTLIYDHYSVDGYMNSKDQPFVDWLDKYTGKTEGTLTDDLLISGATLSSTAVKNATNDAFAAFNTIKGGEQ